MLSDTMLEKLNEQITIELDSANLYLQMSAWCHAQGLDGCARFLRLHSQEEMGHLYKLFDYVNETGALARLGAARTPRCEFDSLLAVFEATLEHERFVTSKINALTDVAFREKDYSSFNFLQWYVAEQHEEEALFRSILDKIELVGTEGRGLFFVDREIGELADKRQATAAV